MASTLPNFRVVLCIVYFVSFSVLFVCKYVLYYCHWVATQLQLNISYHISYLHGAIKQFPDWLQAGTTATTKNFYH